MLASLVSFPAPAMAAATFTGGPDTFPLYVANDHTPFVLHYAAGTGAGLAPNTHYYVKVRFTVGTAPSGSTNRGWTWNPVGRTWVQERDNKPDWSNFPMVTTDASGRVPDADSWLVASFGDDTMAGDYHLMVSLNNAGDDSTLNSSVVPTVTVFDPRTAGGWVHNGAATGAAPGADARVVSDGSGAVLSTGRAETQGVDDDRDSIVDDEDWGPAGRAGDFRMSVPETVGVSVTLAGTPWAPGASFATGPADTDLAIGASDHVAPGAPGTPVVETGDATASISWTAASDDTGVAGYYVYRWVPIPQASGITAYSPVHSRVATLSAGTLTYHDSALSNGTSYRYEVRAFDAATNVGPRSGPATATPEVAAPSAAVSPEDPDGESGWYHHTPIVTLTPSVPGRTVLYAFESTPTAWTTCTAPVAVPDGAVTLAYRETDGAGFSDTQRLTLLVDTVGPRATVAAPAFCLPAGSGAALSFPVSWSGEDTASGIAYYDVEYRTGLTGAWTTDWNAFTTRTSVNFPGSAGKSYYFRVLATDAAGNTGTLYTSAASVVPFDQTQATYSSRWSTVQRTSAYRGSARYTTHNAAYADFKLSKGTLYLVTTTGPKNGKVKVYYRGHLVKTVDTYSKTAGYRKVFQIATYTTGAAASNVRLVASLTRSRSRVEIDGFALRW